MRPGACAEGRLAGSPAGAPPAQQPAGRGSSSGGRSWWSRRHLASAGRQRLTGAGRACPLLHATQATCSEQGRGGAPHTALSLVARVLRAHGGCPAFRGAITAQAAAKSGQPTARDNVQNARAVGWGPGGGLACRGSCNEDRMRTRAYLRKGKGLRPSIAASTNPSGMQRSRNSPRQPWRTHRSLHNALVIAHARQKTLVSAPLAAEEPAAAS